ncbi:SET domain-containing protein [Poriferisphaera sp. WC338]|uniref:SET domain-containing protein n=1 Tax=Poriferisphaera sp. WC338 TaxID=3425129 RepID=UPI003D81BECB
MIEVVADQVPAQITSDSSFEITHHGVSPLACVQNSAIHGRGLFAYEHINEGTIIGRIVGTPTHEDGPHVLWLTDDLGIRVLNDLRFINHSGQPNAAYFDDGEVIALKDIQPGEEITHDYNGEAEEWGDTDHHDDEA